jgi:hypothetical protein
VRICKRSLWPGNLKGENHVEGCKDNIKMDLKILMLKGVKAGKRAVLSYCE